MGAVSLFEDALEKYQASEHPRPRSAGLGIRETVVCFAPPVKRSAPTNTIVISAPAKPKGPSAAALKQTQQQAEREAARLEVRTREFVAGQLLWQKETADVEPLRGERKTGSE
jgi:hypothetical protein